MKRFLCICLLLLLAAAPCCSAETGEAAPTLTLIGHASVRITTSDGTVLYVDPSFPGDYSIPADLVLISHDHSDHSKLKLVTQNEGCLVKEPKDTINPDGSYNIFTYRNVTVEPFPAYNKFHMKFMTTGFLITFDGITVYFASDTSKIPEMESLAGRGIDYALLPVDGEFSIDAREAMECAALIGAGHNIPIHFFDADPALFTPENLLFIPYGETVTLEGT